MSGRVTALPIAAQGEEKHRQPPLAVVRPPAAPGVTAGHIVTALLVFGPLVGVAVLIPFGWGRVIDPRVVGLAALFYLFTGFGIAAGFHRLFTHRSFKANRTLKVV